MVEPGTSLTNRLTVPPVTVPGGNGRFASGRGLAPGESWAPFDPEIGQGARKDLTPGARSSGNDRDGTGHLPLSAPPQSFPFSASGVAAAFLAQQIAQEMAAEIVPPEQAAAAASGSYRAVPDPYISYAGPQIALDITV